MQRRRRGGSRRGDRCTAEVATNAAICAVVGLILCLAIFRPLHPRRWTTLSDAEARVRVSLSELEQKQPVSLVRTHVFIIGEVRDKISGIRPRWKRFHFRC